MRSANTAADRVPSDFALKTMNRAHRLVMSVSGGRMGWRAADMAVLELTTIGRRSGERRKSLLTIPWQSGDTLAIVASRGGDDHHPAWFLNLRDQPAVTVRTHDGTRKMTARIASAEERAKIWPAIASKHSNYAEYQSRTGREIPLVLLDPAD